MTNSEILKLIEEARRVLAAGDKKRTLSILRSAVNALEVEIWLEDEAKARMADACAQAFGGSEILWNFPRPTYPTSKYKQGVPDD